MAGFYVHVPFCASKCIYCDFYSVADSALVQAYGQTVIAEIKSLAKKHPNKKIETIYFGGGTPSILPYRLVGDIIDCIKSNFDCSLSEVTIEVNPCSAGSLDKYRDLGVTRLSIGVQSLQPDTLRWLGRRHTVADALQCVQYARKQGYNISIDLLLGIPNMRQSEVLEAVDVLAPLVDHVSAYILKVEGGTKLAHLLDSGDVVLPTDDDVADSYYAVVTKLAEYGLFQYEISNFAKEGKESQHNLKYWTMDDYIGVGPAAHSFVDGRRYYNTPSIADYIAGKHSGNGCAIDEGNLDITGVDEYVMLGLRLNRGVCIAECKDRFGVDILDRYKAGLAKLHDYVAVKDGRLMIKPEHLLLQNSILLLLFNNL